MSKEGFWRLDYAGQIGSGVGMVVLDTNMVVGCDIVGGTIDGTYIFNKYDDTLDVTVIMTVPANALLVTGAPIMSEPYQIPIKAKLAINVGDVTEFRVMVMGQPVNVRMTKMRDFPN